MALLCYVWNWENTCKDQKSKKRRFFFSCPFMIQKPWPPLCSLSSSVHSLSRNYHFMFTLTEINHMILLLIPLKCIKQYQDKTSWPLAIFFFHFQIEHLKNFQHFLHIQKLWHTINDTTAKDSKCFTFHGQPVDEGQVSSHE